MKLFFTPFLLFLLNIPLFSQAYFPFPESNASWTIQTYWPDGSPNGQQSLYDYQITSDTIINALTYHKLTTVNYSGSFPPYFGVGYVGAFRNDTLNRKVYYYPKDSLQEYLLYDFTLNIGDTIKGYTRDFNHYVFNVSMDTSVNIFNNAVISSVDSILINGVYRKKWNYTSYPTGYPDQYPWFFDGNIIEGIGNTNGLLEGLWSSIDFQNYLSCYLENEIPFYSWGTCLVGLEEEKNIEQIEIYPNPFTTSISIYTSDEIEKISVFNILGEEELILFKPDLIIDLSSLSKGVKILKIKSSKKNYINKILKF